MEKIKNQLSKISFPSKMVNIVTEHPPAPNSQLPTPSPYNLLSTIIIVNFTTAKWGGKK